ncbi:hypothetical protein F5Y08DRAFT_351134 [Xylaria arbuscula]|nr:hypothetical protein F5Y08DRAFT_351134 [Xylaria arbuscula]
MRYSGIITALIGSAAIVTAANHDGPFGVRAEVPEGYTIQPLVWRGAIEENGPELTFNGTIEDVTQQIQAIKRDFTWDSLPKPPTGHEERDSTEDNVNCDIGGDDKNQGVPVSNVDILSNEISKTRGSWTIAAGPRVCSVIARTSSAAVWVCNDNTHSIEVSPTSVDAQVEKISSACGPKNPDNCKGQIFTPDNWNVIVGRKKDDECSAA